MNQVARALRLEFNHLKRVAEADGAKGRKPGSPAFVELIAPHRPGRECVLEREAPLKCSENGVLQRRNRITFFGQTRTTAKMFRAGL